MPIPPRRGRFSPEFIVLTAFFRGDILSGNRPERKLRHASSAPRLDHRRDLAPHLLRPRPVLRQTVGQEHLGVLRLRPGRPLVAGRAVHGRHDLPQRHAQPGHRHRPPQRRRGELGLVGLHPDRRRHGLLLRPAVAALRGHDGPRVLRAPLFGQGGRVRPRLPLGLPGLLLQLHDHGHGQPGRLQDRRRPVRPAPLADPASSSAVSTSSSPRSPASGACWSST